MRGSESGKGAAGARRWIALALGAGGMLTGGAVAAQSPARLTGALAPGGRDFVITLGPIELPAHATHHQIAQPRAQEVPVPGDGWIRGFRVDFVDGAGRPVPHSVLHHVDLIMPDRRDLFAPIMLRIAAAGEETAPVELPRLLGFRVHRGEKILVTAMFSNEQSARAYHGVRMIVRMPWIAGGTWLPPLSVRPFYIDVMPPAGGHAYDLPPGKSSRSWDARPAAAARLLGMGGHLHRYGTLLRFEDLTAHKVIWDARPHLAADGGVAGMPTAKFWWRGGIKVEPDHTYRLTAFYDNPTGKTIPDGAMGALGGILVLAHGSVWPAVNRADPEYRKDYEGTLAGMPMNMPGMNMGGRMTPSPAQKSAPPAAAPAHAHH